jgi:hypothetical protein
MQDNFSACQARAFRFHDKVVYTGEARREPAETVPAQSRAYSLVRFDHVASRIVNGNPASCDWL